MEKVKECHELLSEQFSKFNIKVQFKKHSVLYSTNKLLLTIKYSFEKDNILLTGSNDDEINKHLSRLIKVKYGHLSITYDQLYDILTELCEIITNIYQFCTVCAKKITFMSDKVTSCLNKQCLSDSDELPLNNFLVTYYNESPKVFTFLVQTGLEVLHHVKRDDVLNPFPEKFKSCKEIEKVVPKLWNTSSITNIFRDQFNKISTDLELYNVWGRDLYYFVKFIIRTNNTTLRQSKLTIMQQCKEKTCGDIVQFEVIHDLQKEERFKNVRNGYLFHGSSIGNWYSILRNGLKNCSNTKLMANGAVHGSGIYLSDSYHMSFGYSSGALYVIGVVQIYEPPEKYIKTTGIYVVPKEEDVLLRYLLVQKDRINSSVMAQISSYFTSCKVREESIIAKDISVICSKKLTKELKNIDKLGKSLKYDVTLVNENLLNWLVRMYDFNNKSIKEVTLEIIFDHKYPATAPFVRIITPQFDAITGYIMDDGIICLKELSQKYWSPVISIESLLVCIRDLINESQIRIKSTNKYDLAEAKKTFDTVVNTFKWN